MENRVYCLYRVSTRKQADFKAENQADMLISSRRSFLA